jgi:DNA-binding NtrC family response regulator
MEKLKLENHSAVLIDDDVLWLRVMTKTLKKKVGLGAVFKCDDSRNAIALIKQCSPSVVLVDITMPHLSGEEILEQINVYDNNLPVIIVTGRNEVDLAVRCMKNGAFDYYLKTDDKSRLFSAIHNAVTFHELRKENQILRCKAQAASLRNPEVFRNILTCYESSVATFRYIEAISDSMEPVLITGETGVGKELIAQAIHDSGDAERPFEAVNVAGLDDTVFSDTLFGHVRGAYTGADSFRPGMIEKAGNGTLFLDEIGEMSTASQIKLLRLLQEKEYYPLGSDAKKPLLARIICATNIEIKKFVQEGKFRQDLYYRINAHQIKLPPLRERTCDIPLLFDFFMQQAAQDLSKEYFGCDDSVIEKLKQYAFPGNIRELRALAYNMISIVDGRPVVVEDLILDSEYVADSDTSAIDNSSITETVSFGGRLPLLRNVGDFLVKEALLRNNGNKTRAAKMIGISRQALIKRLNKLS